MEDTPAAAAPATEATPNINSNNETSTPSEVEVSTPQAAIPTDQIENFNKFINANGGYEKAFDKLKQAVSNPQMTPNQNKPAEPTLQAVETAGVSQPQPFKPADGYITPNEINAFQYNKYLAESFPTLGDYVNKGEYLREASSLGIQVMDQHGNFNDKAIRGFLKLKADAIPAPAPSEPVTATPTVTYVNPEGELDSREKAQQIMAQGEGHPQYQAAVNFMRRSLYPNKKAPQTPQSK